MDKLQLVAPCHFGVESVLKREIQDLGYDIIKVEDGRITFSGDCAAVCRANVFLRTAERVMIQVGRVKATTYDQLFEAVKAMNWEDFIPVNGKFWVKKASDIQSIVKKAIVEKLKTKYHTNWFSEDGAEYPIRVFFYKDEAIIALDTSGESLHKRGYRKYTSKAPISETLAAALIMLTPWNRNRILVDPFCGCGTFPIETAMIAANIAPGMNREFTAENWTNFIEKKLWYDAINEANDCIDDEIKTDIQGYDIDSEMIEYSRKNAQLAGVEHMIHFQTRPVSQLSHSKKYGFIITNPPYGERLEEKEALKPLYIEIGKRYKALDSWSAFIITSYEDTEKDMGIKATKNRKIYNGMLKTYFYQFMGPKPPRKEK
jgi:putative N6-adenine-specific DNA methylase